MASVRSLVHEFTDLGHLLRVGSSRVGRDPADLRPKFQAFVEETHQRLHCASVAYAPLAAPVLVIALGRVYGRVHRVQKSAHRAVLDPKVLMANKGDEVQVAVLRRPWYDVERIGAKDAVVPAASTPDPIAWTR